MKGEKEGKRKKKKKKRRREGGIKPRYGTLDFFMELTLCMDSCMGSM